MLSVAFIAFMLFQYVGDPVNNLLGQDATPADWSPAQRRQKDIDATWTKKHGKSHFGFKLSVNVDKKYKMIRKIKASNELWGKIIGSIDTVEKFEAKRLELARHEWARMKASDSRECRNCHKFDSMEYSAQEPRASSLHQKALTEGKTCIDCHKGIAHQLPKEYEEPDE